MTWLQVRMDRFGMDSERGYLPNLTPDATNFRALKGQIIHQTLPIEDEADNGTGNSVRVNRAADTNRYQCHGSIDADLPAVGAAEMCKCVVGHEQYDDGPRLCTELESKRGRYGVKVGDRSAAHAQRPLAIFPAYPNPRLDDRREHQNSCGFPDKLAGPLHVSVKLTEGRINVVVNRGCGSRFGLRNRPGNGKR
jgi:hypothetical protein